MYSSRSLQICPLINRSFGKSVLVETSGAGAPFPHCGAAHGASGGPHAPPEQELGLRLRLWLREGLRGEGLWSRESRCVAFK